MSLQRRYALAGWYVSCHLGALLLLLLWNQLLLPYLTWPQQHQRADCAGQQRTGLLVTVLVVPNSYVSQLVQSWVSCCRSKRLSKGMASMMRQKLAAHVVLVEHGEQ